MSSQSKIKSKIKSTSHQIESTIGNQFESRFPQFNWGFLSKSKFKSKIQSKSLVESQLIILRIKKGQLPWQKKEQKTNQGQKIRHVQVHICTEKRQGRTDGKHGDDRNSL